MAVATARCCARPIQRATTGSAHRSGAVAARPLGVVVADTGALEEITAKEIRCVTTGEVNENRTGFVQPPLVAEQPAEQMG